MLFVATPISLISTWFVMLFTHGGGPFFWITMCFIPGLWFGLYFDESGTLIFWLANIVIQIGYWSLIVIGFYKLKSFSETNHYK